MAIATNVITFYVTLLILRHFSADQISTTFAFSETEATTERPRGCSININGHLKKSSRLILHPYSGSTDGYRFFLPSAGQKDLSFQNGQGVVFACPQGLYEHARCHGGEIFQFTTPVREVNITDVICRRQLRASVRNLGRCYNNEHHHLGIGILLRQDQSTHEFIKLIDVCFNQQLKTSIYAKFTLMQGVENSQKNVKRSTFNCTQYFGYQTQQFDEFYDRGNQYTKLLDLLGSVNQTERFFNRSIRSDLYLTRSYLVGFRDFIYYSQQQATSFCVNSVPIWQVIRKGNWRNLEIRIRQYANMKGKDLTVYSGTHGVLNLPDVNDTSVPIYLGIDENGKGVLPVPKLLWKLVYDRLMRKGIVFVGINNHDRGLNRTQYEVCSDVCNSTESWFNGWNRFKIELGYVYCCTVTEFLHVTNAIPEFRDTVIDILS
ncbi:uncharacterized protein [Periplaneta americana]|uniref:uncharacterized protein n=1 Tax=Periplaneta americana TaxID=6978 RepID=UPI0037E74FA7